MQKAGEKRIRILVVEDEPVISRICLQTLIGEGFDVDHASNGKVAEGMLGKEEYDLLLVDIRTPVMSGKELYQSIAERYPEVVSGVIFTTGDVLAGDTKGFLERSGRPFLPKPFTPDELKTVVKEVLRRLQE
jgi:DNA-binding response OmpR family regulator